jgi:hypothetical protein
MNALVPLPGRGDAGLAREPPLHSISPRCCAGCDAGHGATRALSLLSR